MPPCGNFYPRSPCGERRWSLNQSLTSGLFLSTLSLRRATRAANCQQRNHQISIHALLAESDPRGQLPTTQPPNFYPRSPCGERQQAKALKVAALRISIHALLAESDRLWIMLYSCPGNFYPRSPCGERPPNVLRHCTTYLFLSTLSLRRATTPARISSRLLVISIHALLAESDPQTWQV